MSRAPGSGTRARSREIGYAEAMGEIGFLLRHEAAKWGNTGEQQLDPVARAALKVAADELGKLADFALGSYSLHVDERGGFAGSIEHLDYLEREWNHAPARRELPHHEQSDN